MIGDKGRWGQRIFDKKKMSRKVKKAEGATIRHAHKFLVGRLENIRGVRRNIIVWLALIGVTLSAVSLQFVWFQQSYQTTAPSSGGTYAEGSIGPIDTLNPMYASSSAETAASRLIFSSLYSYDNTGHLQGDLAENMAVDSTSMIYTIKLRKNAMWHDGTKLTAKDVAFTVNLIKNPETRSPLRTNWQDVTVKALDDITVEFKLPAIYAAFPHALTFAVLPEHVLGRVAAGNVRENSFSRSPIGSGPFTLRLLQTADLSRGHKVANMTAFEKYHKGKPLLGRIEVHAYANQEEIVKALRAGEISAATDVNGVGPSQVDTHNYNIISRPINSGVYTIFNNDNPILKDKLVRQALQMGTDTKAIRSALGNVPSLDLPFINDQLSGNDVPHVSDPDRTSAASMLEQAGWKLDGNVRKKENNKLTLTITTTKNAQYEKALESIVGQWRALGIEVNTTVVDTSNPSANFIQTLQQRNYDVLLYELFIGADPDVYAYWHSSQIASTGFNFSNYINPAADAALASSRSRLEPDLRNVKYKTFAKQWLDDAPAIGLYQSVTSYIVNKNIQSLDTKSKLISPTDRYANVLYWSVGEETVFKTP